MEKRVNGMSLLELMVAVAVLGILMVLGISGYRALVQNNRAVAMSNQLTATLQFARSEAIKRGQPVSLCSASDANLSACGAAGDWVNGWIVFADPNGDGVIANAGDRLKVQQALPAGSVINTASAVVTFDNLGIAQTGATNMTLSANGCNGNNARVISINTTGRISITQTACP